MHAFQKNKEFCFVSKKHKNHTKLATNIIELIFIIKGLYLNFICYGNQYNHYYNRIIFSFFLKLIIGSLYNPKAAPAG